MKISVETTVDSSLARVWEAWTNPVDIVKWNFASDDWHCPSSHVDLRVGGVYGSRMEAKDGSFGFDFGATISALEPEALLQYDLGDGRKVDVRFTQTDSGVRVTESFDAEDENSAEMQRTGWQAILDNFRKHVEAGRAV
ncbi:MAG: SRPBCC family protein [Fibrobacterota bacterium]